MTSNEENDLLSLYSELNERMLKGGFTLRSWTSNSPFLRQKMINDEKYVEHDNPLEKILALYHYSTANDTMQLSITQIKQDACTKRSILAESSKIFDPLGLCLPVTVRSKMLMRELWSQNLSWDEPIHSKEILTWSSLASDLQSLPNVCFPRVAITEDADCDLIIFCDASKQCFGCTVYSVQNNVSSLLFAKAKVSPTKPKSLPTLELLSVFLGLKCLPFVLDSFPKVKINSITVAMDA